VRPIANNAAEQRERDVDVNHQWLARVMQLTQYKEFR